MSAHATHATDPHDPGQQAEDAQLYRHVLHDLISIGTDLARLLHQDAIAHAMQQAQAIHTAPPATPGIAIAFDRTARAVRRCIALARSLAHPVPPPRPAQHPAPARPRTLRAVQDAPGSDISGDNDAPEGLRPEPRERPDAPDPDDSLAGRPVAEIIASICRDLGLDSPPDANSWERRTREDTAQLRAHAEAFSGTHKPGAAQQWTPAAQPFLDPQPNQPATTLRAQPGPVHPGGTHADSIPPDDPAEAVAAVLRHATHARWRPPF